MMISRSRNPSYRLPTLAVPIWDPVPAKVTYQLPVESVDLRRVTTFQQLQQCLRGSSSEVTSVLEGVEAIRK